MGHNTFVRPLDVTGHCSKFLAWWQAVFFQFIGVVDMFCDSLRDIAA